MTTAPLPKKPWYKSKIVLLSIAGILTFGTNLLNGWLSGQGVTQDQIAAIEQSAPTIVDTVERVAGGERILDYVGLLYSAVMLVFRSWFTTTIIGK